MENFWYAKQSNFFATLLLLIIYEKFSAAVAGFSKIYSQKSTLQPVASYIQHPNMNQIETN